MKKTAAASVAVTLFVALFAISAFAQDTPVVPQPTPTVSPCPAVSVSVAPAGMVFAPQPVTFTLTVAGGDTSIKPLLSWSLSAGAISSGQGTTVLRADTSDAAASGSVTATVFIGGYDPACANSASGTVEVKLRPSPRKLDEYNDAKPDEEEGKLEAAAGELQADPESKLFLIVYRSAKTKPGSIEPVLQRALAFLTTKRGIAADRIERMYGEKRDPPFMEIWVVPNGAAQPKPTVTPPAAKPAPADTSKPAPKKP